MLMADARPKPDGGLCNVTGSDCRDSRQRHNEYLHCELSPARLMRVVVYDHGLRTMQQ